MQKSELLIINATSSLQPCHTYGIHYRLPVLKALYDKGEASFIAGIGGKSMIITKHYASFLMFVVYGTYSVWYLLLNSSTSSH